MIIFMIKIITSSWHKKDQANTVFSSSPIASVKAGELTYLSSHHGTSVSHIYIIIFIVNDGDDNTGDDGDDGGDDGNVVMMVTMVKVEQSEW